MTNILENFEVIIDKTFDYNLFLGQLFFKRLKIF